MFVMVSKAQAQPMPVRHETKLPYWVGVAVAIASSAALWVAIIEGAELALRL
jgi:hypothetical protein